MPCANRHQTHGAPTSDLLVVSHEPRSEARRPAFGRGGRSWRRAGAAGRDEAQRPRDPCRSGRQAASFTRSVKEIDPRPRTRAGPPSTSYGFDCRLPVTTESAQHREGQSPAQLSCRMESSPPSPSASLLHPSGEINQSAVSLSVFNSLLKTDGIRAALYALLRQSDFRFIGIFRFKDGKARSVVHVDRQALGVLESEEVSDAATYCSFIRKSGEPFLTRDAAVDPRTATHIARDTVRAYAGVPVVAADGRFLGTLCHYDLEARDPDQLDLQLLREVGNVLGRSGLVPEYPAARQP